MIRYENLMHLFAVIEAYKGPLFAIAGFESSLDDIRTAIEMDGAEYALVTVADTEKGEPGYIGLSTIEIHPEGGNCMVMCREPVTEEVNGKKVKSHNQHASTFLQEQLRSYADKGEDGITGLRLSETWSKIVSCKTAKELIPGLA